MWDVHFECSRYATYCIIIINFVLRKDFNSAKNIIYMA